RNQQKAKQVKETYVDDPDQIHAAALLGVESERLKLERTKIEQQIAAKEIDDDIDGTLEAVKTQKLKGITKTDNEPQISLDAQLLLDLKKDSDQTPSATRLETFDEGDEDDASNYSVFVHDKEKEVTEKETPITKPLSSLRTESSRDDVLRSLNKPLAPSKPIGDSVDLDWLTKSQTVDVPEVTMTKPTGPDQRGSIVVNSVMNLTPGETLTLDKQVALKDSCKDANLKKRTHDDQDPHKDREDEKGTRSKSLRVNHPLGMTKSCFNQVNMWSNHLLLARLIWIGKQATATGWTSICRRVPLKHFFNEDLKYLKSGNKDLKGRKYVLSITKRHVAEYKIGWTEEDIGRLFMNTFVEYDMDDMLGIHHWPVRKLAYRGKRVVVTNGKVYSDLKIAFVDEVKVDLLFDYRFLESITMTRVDKKKYMFKESDFSQLNLNDIEDMYVLKTQGKLKHLGGTTEYYLTQSLLVYMRSVIIKKIVEDV
nr:hypothetical protein [Tanacetum cinerariifolium]